MTKNDLVGLLMSKTDGKITRIEADDAITAVLSSMVTLLLSGEKVKLYNIGTLSLFEGAPRKCRNVIRNEAMLVPAKTRVKFTPSSVLKRKLAKMDERRVI